MYLDFCHFFLSEEHFSIKIILSLPWKKTGKNLSPQKYQTFKNKHAQKINYWSVKIKIQGCDIAKICLNIENNEKVNIILLD